MKYVVYEVWTKSRIIDADSAHEAYDKSRPEPREDGMNLCNWHIVPVAGLVSINELAVKLLDRTAPVPSLDDRGRLEGEIDLVRKLRML